MNEVEQFRSNEHSASSAQRHDSALALIESLLQYSRAGIAFIDREFRYQLINQTLADINGFSVEYHFGRKVSEVIPDLWPNMEPMYHQILQTGESNLDIELTGEVNSSPGVERSWLVSYHPVKAVTGSVLGILVMADEITEQKRSRNALLRQEKLLSEAHQEACFGSWVYNRSGQFSWSNQMYQLFGVSPDTFDPNREPFLNLIYPEDRPAMQAWITDCFAGKKPFDLEFRRIRPDGSLRILKGRGELVRDTDTGQTFMTGTIQDITSQRESEKSLRLSQFSVEHAVDQMFWISPEGEILYVNEAVCKSVGYAREELIGKTVSEIDPNFPAEAWLTHWQEVRQRGSFTFESDQQTKDGRRLSTEVTVNYLQHEGEEYNCAVVRDITDRKRFDKEKQEIADRLRFAMHASNVGLWDWEFQSNKVAFSREWKSQLGYAEEEIANEFSEWESRIHPEDLALTIERLQSYLAGKEATYDVEFRMRHKEGFWRWINARGESLRDIDRNQIGMIGCHFDITERKQLMEQMQLMRFCVDHSGDSVFWTGPDGRLLYANKTACSERGYSLEEMLNMTVFDLDVHPDYQPELWGKHFDALKHNGSMMLETKHRAKNGRVFPVEVNANYVQVGNHEFNFASVRDITERTQNAERLRQKKEQLKQLSQELIRTREAELQNLAGALHDDIGQMLTAIKLNLRSIHATTNSIDSSSLVTVVSLIDETIDHVRNLAFNMRPPQLEHLGLVAALEWYLSTQSKIAGFGWKVIVNSDEIQISKDLSTTCFRITQESVTNALRHATAKNIVVELEQEDQKLFLTIRDDGIGFDVNSILQNAVTGKSFGLTNMQERAILMGGHIEFESIPLRGTIIRAVFPLTLTTNS